MAQEKKLFKCLLIMLRTFMIQNIYDSIKEQDLKY